MKTYKIYCYAEHTIQAGKVAGLNLSHSKYGHNYPNSDSDDVFLWEEGTIEELVKEAQQIKFSETNYFKWRCAKNILNYFN